MKKLYYLVICAAATLTSCSLSGNDDEYQKTDWQTINEQWFTEQAELTDADGERVYTRVVPAWNKNAMVLMRWFNDTMLTCDNFRPLYSSTVDCKYIGRLYNDEAFDSSYTNVEPADSIFRSQVSDLITGWQIAFEKMHVGDSVEIIIPYAWGYGTTATSSIPAFSMLKFNVKLVDVAGEYIRP